MYMRYTRSFAAESSSELVYGEPRGLEAPMEARLRTTARDRMHIPVSLYNGECYIALSI